LGLGDLTAGMSRRLTAEEVALFGR
jgi:hypothetical protein